MESENNPTDSTTKSVEVTDTNNIPEADDDLTQFEDNNIPESESMDTELNSESDKEVKTSEVSEGNLENSEDLFKESNNLMEEDSEAVGVDSSEVLNSEEAEIIEENSEAVLLEEEDSEGEEPVRLSQLPLAKIKRIMKIGLGEDSGVKLCSKESIYLVEQATELFVAAIAQQAAKITNASKKKTMTMQHLITTIKESDSFSFLEGTMVPDYDF